jgi:hypothetical protein
MGHDVRMTGDARTASDEIDAIIANDGSWRAGTLAELRRVILSADPEISEEIKWRKPSKPEGVATWVCEGNVCMADLLKNAVRLTFPKGARLDDPGSLFNARLTGDSIRAIDVTQNVRLDDDALRALVQHAVEANREG